MIEPTKRSIFVIFLSIIVALQGVEIIFAGFLNSSIILLFIGFILLFIAYSFFQLITFAWWLLFIFNILGLCFSIISIYNIHISNKININYLNIVLYIVTLIGLLFIKKQFIDNQDPKEPVIFSEIDNEKKQKAESNNFIVEYYSYRYELNDICPICNRRFIQKSQILVCKKCNTAYHYFCINDENCKKCYNDNI